MKKFFSVFFAVLLLCAYVPEVGSAESDIKVYINGYPQSYDVAPLIVSGRTMVPMRGIFEALGAEVNWDDATRSITASKNDTVIKLTVDSPKALVNDDAVMLDAPAMIVSARTLVPLRFVGEALGTNVSWDEQRRSCMIWNLAPELYEALMRLEATYDYEAMVKWLAGLYDKETGGFYFSESARGVEGFYPDIESTSQGIGLLTSNRLVSWPNNPEMKELPSAFRDGFIKFFQDRQDPETGFFYDVQFGSDVIESKKGRNLSQAQARLSEMGSKPLYLTPLERANAAASTQSVATEDELVLPEHYKSIETFRAWLDSWDWENNPYYAANNVISSKEMIQAAGYMDYTMQYLVDLQNKETGLWGPQRNYMALNAAMKLSGFFNKSYPYPNVDKMVQSVVQIVPQEDAYSISVLWNPLVLVRTAFNSYTQIPADIQSVLDENLAQLLNITIDRLQKFKKPDGGFSYYPTQASPTSQGVVISLGIAESDMNATMLGAASLREDIYRMLHCYKTPCFDIYRDLFIKTVENAKPVVKKTKEQYIKDSNAVTGQDPSSGQNPSSGQKYEQDFSKGKNEENASALGIQVTNFGSVKTVKDPWDKKNICLLIETNKDGNVRATLPISPTMSGEAFVAQMDIMIDESSTNPAFSNYFGDGSLLWCIGNDGKDEKTFTLYHRKTASGGENIVKGLAYGDWYTFRIEYIPDTSVHDNTVVRYYVYDSYGDLAGFCETSDYYAGGKENAPPHTNINRLVFTSMSNAIAGLYIDNITVQIVNKEELIK